MTDPREPPGPFDAFLETHEAGALDQLIEWAKQLGAATPAQRVAITEEYRRTQPDSADFSALIEQLGAESVIESLEEIRTRDARAGFRFIDGNLPG